MAGRVSKNSRTATIAGSKSPQVGADTRFIIPLNSGNHAYILNADSGANPHVSTASQQFLDLIAVNTVAGYGPRIESELVVLHEQFPDNGWDSVLTRAREADAFNEPA